LTNGNGGWDSWRVSMAEFKGFVKASLQDIHESVKEVKEHAHEAHQRADDKLDDHDKRITKIEGRKGSYMVLDIFTKFIGWIFKR
tara:strand:- start:852 stop:1106 length:255 start_codon:yes stop_codon:yes gene_type:complete